MVNYQPVIGLEVHVELNTKTKMFCRCSADYFGKRPNTHTCPICLGLPGALPYINRKAIDKCMMIGLALNCQISEKSLFERKNYFYPDLPKGYQISQYRWPLCTGGRLQVTGDRGEVTIRINRVHQEEDTAKLAHQFGTQNYSLIDFNRSGVPLVEIVTEPDFTDSSQVKDYAKKLQQIFRYLGVSNADMERGDMRLEANVSLRELKTQNSKLKSNELPNYVDSKESRVILPNYRVELKNINSFKFMVSAIEYEIKRQITALEKGEKIAQETRGWDEDKKCTYIQRSKEEAHDYRYFPEPDLPELRIKNLELRIKEEIKGKLPQERIKYLITTFGISLPLAKSIVDLGVTQLFEQVIKIGLTQNLDPQTVANYIINTKIDPSVSADQIVEYIKKKHSGIISDEEELKKICKEVVEENNKIVDDYKKGKVTAIQALIGQVMKKTSGKADAGKVKDILRKIIE